MRRFPAIAAVIAILFAGVGSARADRAGPVSIPERTLKADVVVVGKVVGFEKENVQALPYKGAKANVAYQIATVKIDTGLLGADKFKEVRIGSIAQPGARRGEFQLKEGQELLLFLTKHPTADFFQTNWMLEPVDLKTEQGKRDLELVKRIAAVVTDPAKALKSDKPEVRAEAAAITILKYRQASPFGGEPEQVAIGADESKTLLKALAEGNWALRTTRYGIDLNPMTAFSSLGLTDKDGWIAPVIVNNPGAPPVDYGLVLRDAFTKWLEGPGKNYQIKKLVPKAAK